jgi:L-fucose isomerase and related proteins
MSSPRIGIRVIVDGRRGGVRDFVEEPTRRLAQNVKKLIEENLRLPSGEKVEAAVSSTAIGGVAECERVSAEFRKENVGAVIGISKAWAYAAEVFETDKTLPQAIWGFNGSERPGAVFLAGAAAVGDQKGLPVFKIYGRDVQDSSDDSIPEDVARDILSFSRAALAVALMKNKSYLSMGGVCMGIGGSIVNPDLFHDYFGMRCEYVDMTEFVRRIERKIYDEKEYAGALEWTKKNCPESPDPNAPEKRQSREQKDAIWEFIVKMTLIARDLMIGNPELEKSGFGEEALGHSAIAAGFQGQRQWTDHFPNGDFMEAILNSPFDWNGLRTPFTLATENDSLNALTMLMGRLLTGRSQLFADVRAYWSPASISRVTGIKALPDNLKDGFLYLSNSGAAALDGSGEAGIKTHYEMSEVDIERCLKAVKWGAGKLSTFRGGGFSSSFETRGGLPATMSRLNYVKGLGPVLQIAEGYTLTLPEDIKKIIVARTDPTWPKTFFSPILTGKGAFISVYDVMKKWGANHCSLSFGHIGDSLITLASMLRIPVSTHNVPREKIFRPSAWDSFGTDSLENADFLACKNFGAIYK